MASIVDHNLSTFNVAVSIGNPITTGSVAWQTGDRVVFFGGIEEDGGSILLNTPTATGLTFSPLASPDQTASQCWGGMWHAVAGSNGSGAVSATIAGGTFTCGAHVWVIRGDGGLGATPIISMIGTSLTASLNTTAGSIVLGAMFDYNLRDTGYTGTPSSPTPTERTEGQSAGDWSWFVADWEGVAGGSINFGVASSGATPKFTILLAEFLSGTSAAPDAPTAVILTPYDSSVRVDWVPGANNGSPITDYVIEYAPGPSYSSWSTFSDGASTNTFTTITGLSNGTSYKARVSATNAIGTGSASTASAAATPSEAAEVPFSTRYPTSRTKLGNRSSAAFSMRRGQDVRSVSEPYAVGLFIPPQVSVAVLFGYWGIRSS